MIKYILRRLLGMIPMLLLISIVVFSLALAMPGDPFGGEIDPTNTDPEYIERMREEAGLNDPIPEQYVRWITNFVQGDFGKSVKYRYDVKDLILDRLPNTVFLGIMSLIITYIVAFSMGMYAGRKPYTKMDHLIGGFNYFGLAVPSYIAGIVAIYFFSFKLGWIPYTGSVGVGLEPGTLEYWISRFHHVLVPAIILGLMSTASYTQFLRNDIIENSRKDFVRTARAKGTSESKIYNSHILRNSIIPLVTFLGFDLVNLISGAVITEAIFNYPGLGTLLLDSVQSRDYAVVMTIVMFSSLLVLVGNLLADILYGIVDPRIRLE